MKPLDYITERIIEAYNAKNSILLEGVKPLIDTMAVMAAAPRVLPKSLNIVRHLIEGETGRVRLLGTNYYTTRRAAAVGGAFLAHSIEYDDWLAPGYVHAGSIVVPLLLAYGDEKTLEEALRILVASYEAGLLVGSYYGSSHYRNWHSTSTIGSIIAAVTYTLIMRGPSPSHLKASISLAANYMGGSWQVNRAEALYKPLSPSHAVQTGILAGQAGIAENRVVPGSLEVSCKLLGGYCKIVEFDKHGILYNGYKFYPTCRHSHTVIEAAEKLYGKVNWEDIVSIRAIVFREAYEVAGLRDPQTLEQARFSIPFLVSVALVFGKVTFDELKLFNNYKIKELARRISIEVSEEYTSKYPYKQPAMLIVETKQGTLTSFVEIPKGDPQRGVSMKDILDKITGIKKYINKQDYIAIVELSRAGMEEKVGEILNLSRNDI